MCSWCSSARPCSSAASNKLSGSHPDDELDGPGRLAFICENGHCANIVRRKQGEEDRRSKEHNKIAAAIHPAAVHAPTPVPAVSVTTTDSKCTEGYDDAGSDDHDDPHRQAHHHRSHHNHQYRRCHQDPHKDRGRHDVFRKNHTVPAEASKGNKGFQALHQCQHCRCWVAARSRLSSARS